MTDVNRVLVVGEINVGHLSETTAELLAGARTLVQASNRECAVCLLGGSLSTPAQEAIHAGADRVYTVEDTQLDTPHMDLHLTALQEVCRVGSPDIILLGRTELGRELGPRLACRLGVNLLQDCLEIALDPDTGHLSGLRPIYGGNVLARVRCTGTPQVAVLRPKAYTPLESDRGREGEIRPVRVTLDASTVKVRILRMELDTSPGVRLEDARVVVAGGRGLGGSDPFRELQELAGLLGGGTGASRAAVDAGWVPGNWQIGLTGRTITPELYITIGISGASQHMAGCSGAKVIVAINKDREANIFRAARYGVVGDWQNVLPAFMEAVRDLH